jgi:hypothetical protein
VCEWELVAWQNTPRRQLNSLVTVVPHLDGFTPTTALALVQQYDIVLDCSDNPATRYLVRYCLGSLLHLHFAQRVVMIAGYALAIQ